MYKKWKQLLKYSLMLFPGLRIFIAKVELVFTASNSNIVLPSLEKLQSSNSLDQAKKLRYSNPNEFRYNLSVRNRVLKLSSFLQIEVLTDHSLARFGNQHDGGYVMIDDVRPEFGVISFGVGYDISWDVALSALGCEVNIYDDSVDELPQELAGGIFYKERIGFPANLSVTDTAKAVRRMPEREEFLLNCDIEGSEWELFSGIDERDLNKFNQIIVEFHSLSRILENDFYIRAINALSNISKTHFVVNLHANNFANLYIMGNCLLPDVVEVTWASKSKYGKDICSQILIDQNSENTLSRPEISLQFPVRTSLD